MDWVRSGRLDIQPIPISITPLAIREVGVGMRVCARGWWRTWGAWFTDEIGEVRGAETERLVVDVFTWRRAVLIHLSESFTESPYKPHYRSLRLLRATAPTSHAFKTRLHAPLCFHPPVLVHILWLSLMCKPRSSSPTIAFQFYDPAIQMDYKRSLKSELFDHTTPILIGFSRR
ncbi:hypothetical protein AVEN_157750-1 [Araneus ventricosus]|uniref:Uncharacterized protein n=1 Tax=Araneus ventricosus TaxID=182803 RepID=A0A4Y2JFS1_ARAVE|nr:hypothetical protein AVEN_157750-1 [Araneus ventricosus]